MLPGLMFCQALLIHLAMPPLGRSPRGFTPLPQPGGNLDLWAATVRKPAAPSQASCGPTAPREEREGAKRMRREKRRGDHPEVFAPGRADYTLAMDAASSEESRGIALNALQKDFYAASARAPQQSLLSTWLKMHEVFELPELFIGCQVLPHKSWKFVDPAAGQVRTRLRQVGFEGSGACKAIRPSRVREGGQRLATLALEHRRRQPPRG